MGEGLATCEHCGKPVMEVNYAMGPKWMHYTPGAAFQDGTYEFCEVTVARPAEGTP